MSLAQLGGGRIRHRIDDGGVDRWWCRVMVRMAYRPHLDGGEGMGPIARQTLLDVITDDRHGLMVLMPMGMLLRWRC
ncbi:MAG TPA: hypothetical protein VGE07_05300 [Herpetosiphonaceae bacterium]